MSKCAETMKSATSVILYDGDATLLQQIANLAHPSYRRSFVQHLTSVAQVDPNRIDSSPLLDVIIRPIDPEQQQLTLISV